MAVADHVLFVGLVFSNQKDFTDEVLVQLLDDVQILLGVVVGVIGVGRGVEGLLGVLMVVAGVGEAGLGEQFVEALALYAEPGLVDVLLGVLMEYTFFLLYLFVVLPDKLVHLFYLSLQSRVEIVFNVVIAALLETLPFQEISQHAPLVRVLSEQLKQSLVLLSGPVLQVLEGGVEVVLPAGLGDAYRYLHCLLERSETCLRAMSLTLALNSLEMLAHLMLVVLVTRDRRSSSS